MATLSSPPARTPHEPSHLLSALPLTPAHHAATQHVPCYACGAATPTTQTLALALAKPLLLVNPPTPRSPALRFNTTPSVTSSPPCRPGTPHPTTQERIVTIGFGSNSEVFEHSIFLVLCNRLITCALALAYLAATRTPVLPGAPLRSYAAVSLTNVIATSCQYEALRYVSFAVQTLAKSAKALPVMLWGMVYLQKRYKLTEFFHATCITLGCSVFLLTGKVTSRVAEAAAKANGAAGQLGGGGLAGGAGTLLLSPVVTGGALMLLYLLVDGLTSTWQDSMFHGYPVSVCDQVGGAGGVRPGGGRRTRGYLGQRGAYREGERGTGTRGVRPGGLGRRWAW